MLGLMAGAFQQSHQPATLPGLAQVGICAAKAYGRCAALHYVARAHHTVLPARLL